MQATTARREDMPALMALYRACIGAPGCTWNEYYPNEEDIAADIAAGMLFCYRDVSGAPFAAVALGASEEDDPVFHAGRARNPCFLARLVVRGDMRRQGFAERLARDALAIAEARGYDGAMLLVGVQNAAARALYDKLGFVEIGRCRLYDIDWHCLERVFEHNHEMEETAMECKKDRKYALVTASSMGVRITPEGRQPVSQSRLYEMYSTSAETNVLNVSASLGLNTLVLTKFVKDSAIASFIKSELRRRGIEYRGAEVAQGGPWGYRHQFNIADSGFGLRGPVVQNDRAGEVGRTLSAEEFDLDRLFGEEGCEILHLSGLIAALSEQSTDCCLKLARAAKRHGTRVSFDLNYRASFWQGREKELRESFKEIASLSDILIGNEEDFQLALGVQGPEAGGEGLAGKIDGFKGMIARVREEYPNASMFATTLREVESANAHLWGAILLAGDEWTVELPRRIDVLDRIGGGDGFVGGLLYGVLKGWNSADCLHFGWATGVMAASVLTDYAAPESEKQVWSIYEGNARVKR